MRSFVVMLVILLAGALGAQTVRTIGVASTGNNFPFNANGMRYQVAYSAAECNVPTGGQLTEIRVRKMSGTVAQYNDFRLRIAHTSLGTTSLTTNYGTNYQGPLEIVMGDSLTGSSPLNLTPTEITVGSETWVRFPFTTPFNYNGTSNLLVDWSYDSKTGTGWSTNGTTRTRVYLLGGNATSPTGAGTSTGGNWQVQLYFNTGPGLGTSTSSVNLGTAPQGTAGSTQSYTVQGYQTTAATDITAPTGVEIKLSTSSTWGSSINIANINNWGPFTVNARISASAAVGSVSGNITHTSTGLTTVNVSVTGNVTPPTISTSLNTLNLGSTPQGTSSTPVSYTVSGSGMQALTTITAPTNVEISLTQTGTYTSSLQITATGQWGPTTIWARIRSTATQGSITGNITHVSTGATTRNVAVNGTVTGPTILTSTGSLNLGSTYLTYAGTPVGYTVSGSILSGQTVITAPTGVEVSFSQTTGYANSITETQTGTWGPTTV